MHLLLFCAPVICQYVPAPTICSSREQICTSSYSLLLSRINIHMLLLSAPVECQYTPAPPLCSSREPICTCSTFLLQSSVNIHLFLLSAPVVCQHAPTPPLCSSRVVWSLGARGQCPCQHDRRRVPDKRHIHVSSRLQARARRKLDTTLSDGQTLEWDTADL